MSAASARPAPSLKRIIAHLKERSILFNEDEEGHQYIEVGIEDAEQIIKALEAQPAAERTALEKVRVLRERLDSWVRQFETANPGSPALRYTRQAWKAVRDEIDFRFPELDAQERAGAGA